MEKTTNDLRREYKLIRKELSTLQRIEMSQSICNKIEDFIRQDDKFFDYILFFYPLENEVNLLPLANKLLLRNYNLCFPRVIGCDMSFFKVQDLDNSFSKGYFDVMEPGQHCEEYIYRNGDKVLCITPLLIFDDCCNRVGYGKGFYDRYFVDKNQILKLGVAFDCQRYDRLWVNEHDIPLDYIFTNTNIYKRDE